MLRKNAKFNKTKGQEIYAQSKVTITNIKKAKPKQNPAITINAYKNHHNIGIREQVITSTEFSLAYLPLRIKSHLVSEPR